MSLKQFYGGAINLAGLSLMLAIFAGLGAFTFRSTHHTFDFAPMLKLTALDEQYQADQQHLVKVMCETHFGLAVILLVLTVVYAAFARREAIRSLLMLVMLIPVVIMFCMLLYFSIRQGQIIADTRDGFRQSFPTLAGKGDFQTVYACDGEEECAEAALLDITRFWFLGVFSSCFVTVAFAYAVLFYVALRTEE